jgi:hypothetical protein
MGLKDKWADSRERARQDREDYAAQGRWYAKSQELRGVGIFSNSSVTEADLDAMIAAEKLRRSEVYAAFMRAGIVITFPKLGVQVLKDGDAVYTIGIQDGLAKSNSSRPLGRLAGAVAQVTEGTSAFSLGKAMLMPLATAPLASKETADALITFADGTVHTFALDGSYAVREAGKQCVQFNAAAGAITSSPTAQEEATADLAARLRKLQELLEAGLLGPEEFTAKRATIIDSI